MTAWKVFEARKVTPTSMAVIGIQARGTFAVNRKAHELLIASGVKAAIGPDSGGEMHVELMYDESRHAVGMRLANPGKNTYPMRKQPRSEAYLVSAKAFMVACKIEMKAERFTAHMEDDILVFSTKRAAEPQSPKKPHK